MFSLKKATIPAVMNTSNANRMIGRRVSPKTTSPLSTRCASAKSAPTMADSACPIYCEGSQAIPAINHSCEAARSFCGTGTASRLDELADDGLDGGLGAGRGAELDAGIVEMKIDRPLGQADQIGLAKRTVDFH